MQFKPSSPAMELLAFVFIFLAFLGCSVVIGRLILV